MKKFLTALIGAIFAFGTVTAFAACDSAELSPDKVTLRAITPTEVLPTESTCDYYVVPEPAASTKVTATGGKLAFAGDLQTLYGSADGYPQAVVVAKNELCSTATLTRFIDELNQSDEWLQSADSATIAEAIQANLTEGMTATFQASNLTRTVIENCGINFTSALDDKQEIKDLINAYNAVSATGFGTPSDGFFYDSADGTSSEYSGTLTVYAPDGAPALGLAGLMASETAFYGDVEYHIVDSTTISTFVTFEDDSKNADICVLPVNAAVKLLGSGEKYKLIGTLTHGNLYLLGKEGCVEITSDNVSELCGKTVGVIQLANVPGLTFEVILSKYGLEYEIQA